MNKQTEIKIHPDYPEEYITGKVTFFGRELVLFGGVETGFEMYERLFEQIRDYSAHCRVHTVE